MSKGRKIIKSAVFGQLPILIQVFSGFVMMPLLIKYFGDRQYGLWVLIAAFVGYFGMLDLGFSKTIVRFVSRYSGPNKNIEGNKWITIGLFLLGLMSFFGLIFLFIGIWSMEFYVTEDLVLLQVIFAISGTAFVLALPSRIFTGVLQAHIRDDIVSKIGAIIGIMQIGFNLFAIYMEFDFLIFVCFTSFFSLLNAFLMSYFALKIHVGYVMQRSAISVKNLKAFIDYSGFSFIAELSDLIRFRAYPLIITSFLGISSVTTFQISNRILDLLKTFHNKILINFTPVFSQIEGEFGIGKELKETYFFSLKISSYLVMFTVGITAIIGRDFIFLWLGEEYAESGTLLLIGLIGSLSSGIQVPAICYLFGTSNHRFYALSNSIEAFLILGSSIVFVNYYGLVGMLFGASVSTFLVKTFIQPIWICRELKITLVEMYLKNTLLNVLKVLLFLLVPYILSLYILKSDYFRIFTFLIISTLLYVPYIMMFGFSISERLKLFNAIPFLKKNN